MKLKLDAEPHKSITLPEDFNFGFDIIDHTAQHRDKVAYVAIDSSGNNVTEHTFSELRDESNRVANILRSEGVERGEFAVVIMPRVPAWYEVIIACIKLGVIAMPGTNLLTARDIEFRINKAGASTVIVGPEHVGKIEAIRKNCPTLLHVFIVGGRHDGWLSLDDERAQSSPLLNVEDVGQSRSDELMMAYFTSGTTAHPKLVPRTHGYALSHFVTGAYWLDLKRDDLHWTLSDTGWAKAAWGMLFAPWLMDATIVLFNGSGFDADLHLDLVERLGVTTFCAPPTVFRLFAQMNLHDYNLSSIRHTVGAGEPLNPEIIRIWKDATNTEINDGYGQTETINIVANRPGLDLRPGSMGKSVPGFDVRVVDDQGETVADNEIGHIALFITDPPPIGLFDGYLLGPDEYDRSSFHHDCYFTGDTATRDADGYIWFVGRSDDVISSAGYRISPFEVESALIEHPAIIESAVVAKKDDTRGSIVKAFVVLGEGFAASDELAADIQNFVKELTAPYKYPREIEFRESFPKTISGKIRRVELREQ